MFLAFVSTVFQPILSPLLPAAPLPSVEELGQVITARWQNYIESVPVFVMRILRDGRDSRRTLSRAFFELALRPEAARLFGLVHFCQQLPPRLIDRLRPLLTADGASQILDNLITIAVKSKSKAIPWLPYGDKEACPSLFQRVVMSQLDFNTYSAASIHGQLVPIDTFSASAYLMTGENEAECLHNRLESTLQGSDDPRSAIRHLLQTADPIPVFTAIPASLTIQDFFTEYLISRGPRQTRVRREECASVLETKCQWDQVRLGKAMQEATLERTKEIKALSAFTRIAGTYTYIHNVTEKVIVEIEKVLVSVVFTSRFAKRFTARRSFDDYVKKPAQLVDDYLLLTSGIQETDPHGLTAAYSFLTASFDFEKFRNLRSDCARLDQILGPKLEREQTSIIAALFPRAAEQSTGFNKQKFLYESILAIQEKNPECLDILRRAFREASPIIKLDEIVSGIAEMRKYIQTNAPPTMDLGEDEWLPLTLAYFYLANPQFIVTNYVFVHDFCYPSNYGALFATTVVQPISSLQMLVGLLGNEFQPNRLFRIKVDDRDG
jgi:hypothetical protein